MIDEKKLIEEIKSIKYKINGVDGEKHLIYQGLNYFKELILETINEQPKVGEWIPCSEQEEPTEDGMYLVSGRWLRSGEKVVDSCGFFGEWKCANNFIIEAWMPLPPAYKGE